MTNRFTSALAQKVQPQLRQPNATEMKSFRQSCKSNPNSVSTIINAYKSKGIDVNSINAANGTPSTKQEFWQRKHGERLKAGRELHQEAKALGFASTPVNQGHLTNAVSKLADEAEQGNYPSATALAKAAGIQDGDVKTVLGKTAKAKMKKAIARNADKPAIQLISNEAQLGNRKLNQTANHNISASLLSIQGMHKVATELQSLRDVDTAQQIQLNEHADEIAALRAEINAMKTTVNTVSTAVQITTPVHKKKLIAIELLAKGMSKSAIAVQLDVNRKTITRWLSV
jgi:transposase